MIHISVSQFAVRVVNVLGKEIPTKLFKETQKIEADGGMLIMVFYQIFLSEYLVPVISNTTFPIPERSPPPDAGWRFPVPAQAQRRNRQGRQKGHLPRGAEDRSQGAQKLPSRQPREEGRRTEEDPQPAGGGERTANPERFAALTSQARNSQHT